MELSWASQIEAWNERIQAGDGQSVARAIGKAQRGRLSLEVLTKIANLAWRVGRPEVGLRLLFPELRRQSDLKVEASPEAFSEYAANLIEVGAVAEAKVILKEALKSSNKAKFYYALLLFKEWDYPSACALLEEYVATLRPSYHQIVARVNLASAYVNTKQWAKATELLGDLQIELSEKRHWLLLGNCLEIESQAHFEAGRYERALELLALSESHLGGARNMGWLYCKKWQFLNRLYLSPAEAALDGAPLPGRELRAERAFLQDTARLMRSWETLRELDWHWALRAADQRLLDKVYFGSPAPAYRRALLEALAGRGSPIAPGPEFAWVPRPAGREEPRLINLEQLAFAGKEDGPGLLVKRFLLLLCSDFYAPFSVGRAYSGLYEGQYYDFESSPDRVFQAARRLRSWLGREFPDCGLASGPQGYALSFAANCGLLVPRDLAEAEIRDREDLDLRLLREFFPLGYFTSSELGARMGLTTRSANRALKALKASGKVVSEGRGRFTRFKLAS